MTSSSRTTTWERVYATVLVVGSLVIGLEHLVIAPEVRATTVQHFAGPLYATEQMSAFAASPALIGFHAAMGVLFTILLPCQFSVRMRTRFSRAHRWIGYAFVASAWSVAVSGVAVAYVYPFAGRAGIIPNALFGGFLIYCTIAAVAHARARRVAMHRAWMIRASAIGLGIVLSRVYLPILVRGLELPPAEAMAQVFWLGSGTNLLIAELWLRRTANPSPHRNHKPALD